MELAAGTTLLYHLSYWLSPARTRTSDPRFQITDNRRPTWHVPKCVVVYTAVSSRRRAEHLASILRAIARRDAAT